MKVISLFALLLIASTVIGDSVDPCEHVQTETFLNNTLVKECFNTFTVPQDFVELSRTKGSFHFFFFFKEVKLSV